jgi:hypothetical protein
MNFYFDESGSFDLPASSAVHRAAIVVGIAIPDHVQESLFMRFKEFVSTLSQDELSNGEPKGALLTTNHRHEFAGLLSEFGGKISLTPVTLDLSSVSGSYCQELNKTMHEVLSEAKSRFMYPTARDEIELLSRQFRNLSNQQAMRVFAIANCFREALAHAVLFLSHKENEPSWDNPRFEIDRVQVKAGSREEKVLSLMILAWLEDWSRQKPLVTIKEIHTPNHLFIRKYCMEQGVDIGKIIRGNMYWVGSANSIGIEIADISANIVYCAAQDLNDSRQSLTILRKLMKGSSFYSPKRVTGIFSLTTALNSITVEKYRPLYEALKA